MKFEMETEPITTTRHHIGRRNFVIIACTTIVCVLLTIVYVRLESAMKEENRRGYDAVSQVPEGPKGERGAPGSAGNPNESESHDITSPEGKTTRSEPADPLGSVETSTEGILNLTSSKCVVEGIIAGTDQGAVIIPLESLEQRTISSTFMNGVAFSWHSCKVYWIEYGKGLKIADLDGTDEEVLISDPFLGGLSVDHITSNLYYGVLGSNASIRVCDSMGNKCVTIASGVNNVGRHLREIALFPSEGLMFWSGQYMKIVTSANMDGTNATVIISEDVYGIYLDEFTKKLYWADFGGQSIGHCDSNGYNPNVLNIAINIAVDGDTLYFAGEDPNGIYQSIIDTSNRQVSFIANTPATGSVYDIALYGRNRVFYRPNHCSNSPCANLCVLTRVSYTCL